MDGMIGQRFGPYEITERIGEGGMAEVYKGYQKSLNRYVAIKVLRHELARDGQSVERFRREALAVAELSHPNILHVYDAGFAHGVYYIVMAYVEGGSLKDVIMQGAMEPESAASIAAQLADALSHAHRQGLVHRDVKPTNILMTRDGRPLLTDFGIAKAVHESVGLTRTGTSIGTPEYMAPEQIQGQAVDGRTDIYALGIVLYEMLVGWTPFTATTPVATLYKQVNERPPPLRQANVSIPPWLDGIVMKALAKRPQDRFQQASDFAATLRQRRVADTPDTPVPVVTPEPTQAPRAGRKRRGRMVPLLIVAILALLLGIAAVAIYMFAGNGGDKPPPVITVVVPRDGAAVPAQPGPELDEQLTSSRQFGGTRGGLSREAPNSAEPWPLQGIVRWPGSGALLAPSQRSGDGS